MGYKAEMFTIRSLQKKFVGPCFKPLTLAVVCHAVVG